MRAQSELTRRLSLLTPRLRRYAQALSNVVHIPSESADALVQRTLMHALQTGPLSPRSDMTVWLYSLLTQFHRDAQNRLHGATAAGESRSLYGSTMSDKPLGHGHAPEGLGAGSPASVSKNAKPFYWLFSKGSAMARPRIFCASRAAC